MLKGRQIKGLRVLTYNDGKEVGRVEDLLIDREKGMLKAIIIDKPSILKNAKYVELEHIVNIGRDAVMISGIDAVLDDQNDLNKMSWQKKLEKNVFSVEGTDIGTIQDVVFEFPPGRISGIEMSGGLWADLNQGRKVIPWEYVKTGNEESFMVETVDENLWM